MLHLKTDRFWRHVLSVPFIYAMIFPIVFLDLVLELYHRVAFRLYDIPYVKREKYIRIDRHKLSYLNLLQKFHCAYCGYANGLFHYALVIAGLTEHYWCGIQHHQGNGFVAPAHHKDFVKYDDENDFNRKYRHS